MLSHALLPLADARAADEAPVTASGAPATAPGATENAEPPPAQPSDPSPSESGIDGEDEGEDTLDRVADGYQRAAEVIHEHAPGSGFQVADTEFGSLDIRMFFYLRYLNQLDLDRTYTDSFGTTRDVDIRHDIFFNKVNIYFRGWLLDPKFKYQLFVWTANTSQGLGAQVVVAGSAGYEFSRHFKLYGGTGSLPGTRSTSGNFPLWLSVDARTISDEYFRPSYTFGVWTFGELFWDLGYFAMLGNNLSQLGIDAGQLDDGLDTFAAQLAWTPLAPYRTSFGDFEHTEQLAARFAVHFTRSSEDVQSQPGTDDIDNVQIRISDGNRIWDADLFGPGIRIDHADYQMFAANAGLKLRGWSLMAEYYYRWVDELIGVGIAGLPFSEFVDQGFQVQASAMVIPELLQLYAAGALVFGEYGEPWEVRGGFNWFPFRNRTIRWNNELIYVDRSPAGGLSLPYAVGDRAVIFHSNVEVYF